MHVSKDKLKSPFIKMISCSKQAVNELKKHLELFLLPTVTDRAYSNWTSLHMAFREPREGSQEDNSEYTLDPLERKAIICDVKADHL